MARPQDNAPPGFVSDVIADATQDAGPWTAVPPTPPLPPPGVVAPSLALGVALPIISIGDSSVFLSNSATQQTVSLPISSLPPGVQLYVGMLVQLNTDGTVYLLLPGGEEDEEYPPERVEETHREYGEPTYPGHTLQAIEDYQLTRAKEEFAKRPWWHNLP